MNPRSKEEPEDLPEGWQETAKAFLAPLRAEASEGFVQDVMRKVRSYGENRGWIRWPVFVRWAFPALALSVAGFTLSLSYALRPVPESTESLLLEGREPAVLANWDSGQAGSEAMLTAVAAE